MRIARPAPAVAFGRRDVVSPGYLAAARVSADLGYPGIERISGGRATAYSEATVVLGFTIPARQPARDTTARFEWVSRIVAETLVELGADALVGEIEGEYCPGHYSISLGGRTKVAGLGQRMIPGAAHVGVVLTVAGPDELVGTLVPVYRELGIEWRPETAGAVAQGVPGVTADDFESALLGRLRSGTHLVDGDLDPETEGEARSMAPGFASPGGPTSDPDRNPGG